MSRTAALFLGIVAWCSVCRGAAAEMTRDEAAVVLAEASEHFRRGTAALESNGDVARSEFDAAIAGFERIAQAGGIRNGKLLYNVGCAYLMKGDIGRAILNFKRAERLISGDPNLASNLAYARQRVANKIDAPAEERVRRALLFWHDETPARSRFAVFLWCYVGAWCWALARMVRPGLLGGWWPIGGLGLVAVACLGSLLVQRQSERGNTAGVIVAGQTIGRKGPDSSAYEPSFTEPLHSGVEVVVLEHRPGWLLARLGDGRTTWLESAAVEAVGGL
ncbi:MAG: hypothetical protein JNK58_04310 [Phycisphaerae bacterium]|nr:hypothetical protein [Phycisphaerae bacterium]